MHICHIKALIVVTVVLLYCSPYVRVQQWPTDNAVSWHDRNCSALHTFLEWHVHSTHLLPSWKGNSPNRKCSSMEIHRESTTLISVRSLSVSEPAAVFNIASCRPMMWPALHIKQIHNRVWPNGDTSCKDLLEPHIATFSTFWVFPKFSRYSCATPLPHESWCQTPRILYKWRRKSVTRKKCKN